MSWQNVYSVRPPGCMHPQNVWSGVRTLCIAILLSCLSANPAQADCPAAPLETATDMVVSFLTDSTTQAGPATLFASTVEKGMLVYDGNANALKFCDGNNWLTLADTGGAGANAAGPAGYVQLSDGSGGLTYSGSTAGQEFFWDNTNKRLGIGTAAPAFALEVVTPGYNNGIQVKDGTNTVYGGLFTESGTMAVVTRSNHGLRFGTNDTTRMVITNTGAVAIGVASPDASSLLDLTSTTQGFLPPRMTETQRDAIASPATGLVVYNTDTNALNYYDGDSWEAVGTGAGGGGPSVYFHVKGEANKGGGTLKSFPTVVSNEGGAYNNTTGVFTAPKTGVYFFNASVLPTGASTITLYLRKNGASLQSSYAHTGEFEQLQVSSIAHLSAGDTVDVVVSGAGLHTNSWDSFYGSIIEGGGGGGGSTTLAGLTDVDTTGVADGQALVWNNSTSKWEPGTVASGAAGALRAATFGWRSGAVQTLQSSGIASIVRVTTGTYDVTWTTPFANDDYVVVGSCNAWGTGGASFTLEGGSGGDSTQIGQYANKVRVGCRVASTNTMLDVETIHVAAFTVDGLGGSIGGGGSLQWADVTGGLSYASGGAAVGVGTLNASAILQADSTTKGFLPPRMTTAQRDAIASPAAGLTIFNTTTNALNIYNGTSWAGIGTSAASFGASVSSGSLSTGWTDITGFTENFDTGSNFNPTTGVFTAPAAGAYIFTSSVHGTCNSANFTSTFKKNGSAQAIYSSRFSTTAGTFMGSPITSNAAVLHLNVNDTVSLYMHTDVACSTLLASFTGSSLGGGSASSGGSATAAGDGGQVQFNDGSDAFAADANLHWDNTNKRLGIGTATPVTALDVLAGNAFSLASFTGTASNAYLSIHNTNATPAGAGLVVGAGSGGLGYFRYALQDAEWQFYAGGGASADRKMVIEATGNVGVGTATPASKLQVAGGLQIGDDSDTCPGASNVKIGTLRFNSGALQICKAGGWSGVGGGVPTGTIAAFAAASCPDGWAEYTPARGRFLRGIDNGAGIDGAGTRAPGHQQEATEVLYRWGRSVGWHYAVGDFPDQTAGFDSTRQISSLSANYINSDGSNNDTYVRLGKIRPANVAVLFCQYTGTGGGGADTLAGLSCSTNEIPKWNGTAWACAADEEGGASAGAAGDGGQIQFNDGSDAFAADANLHWDNTNKRLGIGTATPVFGLEVNSTIGSKGSSASGYSALGNNTVGGFVQAADAANNQTLLLRSYPVSGVQAYFTAGNVGIGTATPASKLQVAGGLQIGDDGDTCPGTSNVKVGTLKYDSNTLSMCNTTGWVALSTSTGASSSGPSGYVQLSDGAGGFTTSGTTAGEQFYWNNVTKRLGIGTASPSHPLQVEIGANGSGYFYLTDSTAPGGAIGMGEGGGAVPNAFLPVIYASPRGSNTFFGTYAEITASEDAGNTAVMRFTSRQTPLAAITSRPVFQWLNHDQHLMTIGANGNVGIGTTAPTQKLHVHGPVRVSGTIETGEETSLLHLSGGPIASTDAARLSLYGGSHALYPKSMYLDADTISFRPSNYSSVRMIIDSAGNVGIGTGTSDTKLSVIGTVATGTIGTEELIKLGRPLNSGVSFPQAASIALGTYGIQTGFAPGSRLDFKLKSANTHGLTTDVTVLTMNSNGNVGIGTTAPGDKLQIEGNPSGGIFLNTTGSGSRQAHIRFGDGGAEKWQWRFNPNDTGDRLLAYSYTLGADVLSLEASGRVGIGTQTPTYKLHVNGGSAANILLFSNATPYGQSLCRSTPDANGYYYIGTCSSLTRYKQKIAPLSLSLDTVMRLRPVEFEWKPEQGGQRDLGFLAEEVEAVAPLLGQYDEGKLTGVRYEQMTALLVKAVQELKAENDNLRDELKAANDNDSDQDAAIEALRRELHDLKAAR